MNNNLIQDTTINKKQLFRKVTTNFFIILIVFCILFFLPAGTFLFWEAWVYLGILFLLAAIVMSFLFKKNPELLDRRMRFKEKRPKQKEIIKFSYLFLIAAFIIPGFDERFDWSFVSVEIVIISDILICLGYFLFVLVIKENSFASRIIEVEQNQKVITTGPYSVVRHPMYASVLIIYFATPVALGSYWAIIPMLSIIYVLVQRILDEEKVLLEELEGYREYTEKTKYRLIPGLW